MFCLTRPSAMKLDSLLQQQALLSPTYSEVGFTRDGREPDDPRYHQHTGKIVIGIGRGTFDRAVAQMRAWKHFPGDGIVVHPAVPDIKEGTHLAVCAHHLLFWSINVCRIMYVIDEDGADAARFGYGYGTLPVHSEQGEERFLLTWDAASDEVTYEVRAFSRSNNIAVTLLWPLAKVIQDKFRLDSLNFMKVQ